jgi:hypothetical protein
MKGGEGFRVNSFSRSPGRSGKAFKTNAVIGGQADPTANGTLGLGIGIHNGKVTQNCGNHKA